MSMANFTDNTVKLKARIVIDKFYPLHQNTASVSAFNFKSYQNDAIIASMLIKVVGLENESELSRLSFRGVSSLLFSNSLMILWQKKQGMEYY